MCNASFYISLFLSVFFCFIFCSCLFKIYCVSLVLKGKKSSSYSWVLIFCKNICFSPTNFLRMCCYRDDCLKERMRRSNSRWTFKEQNTYFMSLFPTEPALVFTPLLMKSLWKKGRYLEILWWYLHLLGCFAKVPVLYSLFMWRISTWSNCHLWNSLLL